ncbi:uncharacterized protein APUU_12393A [Aspergillus puulaauensis]|uniref:Lipocalin-like domain-containing protein n=1 Tax=Aspergillus puulaauensis TaxID=1220207 RepID=A0A7R7XDY9_9EURO|nr:uncharacterized protein APUU_12393A [Aspergillus puulaauensis]BCS19565.1 hypothetical protein APUU_12393A [Aspergillus puulaauensis]
MSIPVLVPPQRFRQSLNSEPPSPSSSSSSDQITAPSLAGTWYITRSSSPFWRDKHGVCINLTPEDAQQSSKPNQSTIYTNRTAYRTSAETSASIKTVSGTDRRVAISNTDGNCSSAIIMEWRGSGWLRIAKTRWEILGFGAAWMVVYADKSMFTPAGISVYSREKELNSELEGEIQDALARMMEGNSSEELAGFVKDIHVIGI